MTEEDFVFDQDYRIMLQQEVEAYNRYQRKLIRHPDPSDPEWPGNDGETR